LKRTYVVWSVLLLAAGSCGRGRKQAAEPAHKVAEVGQALRPAFFSKALRDLGGAHFHGTVRFAVGPAGAPADVTTTTDVWLDRAGNYRLHEENDRDGGRDVVLFGRELSVALRYGKMIRRVAEDPEPGRLLEEALGAPWAAFELVAPHATVARTGAELYGGAKATVFELRLAEGGAGSAAGALAEARPEKSAALVGLRAWRQGASIEALSGRAIVDDATGALMKADLSARFSAKGEGGTAVQGTVDVHTLLSEVAATPTIARPDAEDLALRQRIVPEQRELLRGLPETRLPEPTRKSPVRAGGPRP
jgi:hypothetical protein